MKELQKIVSEARRALQAGKPVALATVVSVEGSAYRLPGARMLIVDGRWTAGSISGGCLEDDVILRAQTAIASNRPATATYDTTSDDDVIFGVGLGCKGVVSIWIEPLVEGGDGADFVAFARRCLDERVPGLAATVVEAQPETGVRVGSRLLSSTAARASNINHAALEEAIERRLAEVHTGDAGMVNIMLDTGSVGVFIERIDPPTPLIVFGAGHDAMPVVRLAKDLGWHVTVVDHRPAYATPERFPEADRIVIGTAKDAASKITLDHDTLALIMTHNYVRDLEWLQLVLPQSVRYVGALGPRRRTENLLADLAEKGFHPAREQLARLFAPVGLDIGSEGPAEVALSILAEMQAVLAGRSGGHLRERKRPIHARDEVRDRGSVRLEQKVSLAG
jgi:xanthine dehydrogenase accessory factor